MSLAEGGGAAWIGSALAARERRRGRRRAAARMAYALVLLAVCAVFPLFVSNAIGYVPLVMAVLMMVASRVYLAVVVSFLDCAQKTLYHECVRGEADQLVVTLKNTSALVLFRVDASFAVCNAEGDVDEMISARSVLDAHESRDFNVDVRFDHIGTYVVGLWQVEVFDFLGLFSKRLLVDERCSVRVVPRIQELDSIEVSQLSATENYQSMKSVLSDSMNYAYVRDYAMGDPMKMVHWKLSARGNDHLYTKLYELQTNPGVAVFLDFCSQENDPERRLDLFDVMVEAGFSLMDYTWHAGIESTLAFRGKDGARRQAAKSTLEELDLLVDEMPRLGAEAVGSVVGMMEEELGNPDAPPNFILITSELSDDVVEGAVRLCSYRPCLRVILVIPGRLSSAERSERVGRARRLAESRVPVSVLESSEGIWKAASS